jgi:hypothetical protein
MAAQTGLSHFLGLALDKGVVVDSTPHRLRAASLRHLARRSLPPEPPASEPWAKLLTLREAAGILRVDMATLVTEARSGCLPTISTQGRLYLDGARLLEAFRSPVDEFPRGRASR